VLNGKPYPARSLSFLSIIAVTELGGSLKLILKPEVVVIDKLVDAPDIMLETSALSKMPKSDAKSFKA
jgi:hypothetical protein